MTAATIRRPATTITVPMTYGRRLRVLVGPDDALMYYERFAATSLGSVWVVDGGLALVSRDELRDALEQMAVSAAAAA